MHAKEHGRLKSDLLSYALLDLDYLRDRLHALCDSQLIADAALEQLKCELHRAQILIALLELLERAVKDRVDDLAVAAIDAVFDRLNGAEMVDGLFVRFITSVSDACHAELSAKVKAIAASISFEVSIGTRIEIANAIGMSTGHWYKCGKCGELRLRCIYSPR